MAKAQWSNQRLTVIAKNESRKSQIIQNYSRVEAIEKKIEKNRSACFSGNFAGKTGREFPARRVIR
jgi:hypothetical protein